MLNYVNRANYWTTVIRIAANKNTTLKITYFYNKIKNCFIYNQQKFEFPQKKNT